MIDLRAVRADTPGCRERIFLDSAGSSLPPNTVTERVITHLRREADVGGYVAADECAAELETVRADVARLIGATAPEVAFSDSASRSWNDFFLAAPLKAGDRILISRLEYAATALTILGRARACGATVEVMPSDTHGRIDVRALANILDERVALVSIVHSPTNSGLLNPVREVVDLAHEVGALVLLDACQSIGQIAVDVRATGVDGLSATGRKWLRGPRGTGFLYVATGVLERLAPAAMDHHGGSWVSLDEFGPRPGAGRFELFEASVAARLGLGTAVRYLLDLGVDEVERAVRARAASLRALLREIDGVQVRDGADPGPAPADLGAIVTFTVDGHDPVAVTAALAATGVTVRGNFAESTRLDMSARGLDAVVRASPHYFVDDDDLARAADAVRGLVRGRADSECAPHVG